METNLGKYYTCGQTQGSDHVCDFDIPEGSKVIAVAGVMQVLQDDCKLLNLSIIQKAVSEDCDAAVMPDSYRVMI